MKKKKTLELCAESPWGDFKKAARLIVEAQGQNKGLLAEAAALRLARSFTEMPGRLKAPFEFRFGSPTGKPDVVIYPAVGKQEGEKIKKRALQKGEWATEELLETTKH